MTKIERLLKYADGGKIRKFAGGGSMEQEAIMLYKREHPEALWMTPNEIIDAINTLDTFRGTQFAKSLLQNTLNRISQESDADLAAKDADELTMLRSQSAPAERIKTPGIETETPQIVDASVAAALGVTKITEQIKNKNTPSTPAGLLSSDAKAGIGIASTLAVGGILALDLATMGDRNFSASSKAIDTGVHAATGALMASGNPYAMIAGAALEGLNWITKAGGKTVLGYDVNINNSGYGNMGHMESESGRIWDRMDRKLAKRNELVKMALAAADISEDTAYEQEARTNSVTNVLQLNQIALSGGIDTSLLGN